MTATATDKAEVGTAESISAVDKLVLATVNAPYKREISASVLKNSLLRAEPDDWLVHVATFFTDVNPDLIFGFADLHGISKSDLARAYLAMKTVTGEFNPDLEVRLVAMATVAR